MVAWNAGGLAGRTFLDLSPLRAWSGIRAGEGRRWSSARSPRTRNCCATRSCAAASRCWPRPARTVGGVQIQNRGTIGGNIANASPAGDTFPPLAVYEAAVVAVSARGPARDPVPRRSSPGPSARCLAPGELIEPCGSRFRARPPKREMFRKVGTRAAQAISKTVAAGLLWLKRDGTVEELRFALGSMAPTVRRLRSAEAFVRGQRLTPAVVREAVALVSQDVTPIDDVRSTAEYRLAVSRNLLLRFLSEPR